MPEGGEREGLRGQLGVEVLEPQLQEGEVVGRGGEKLVEALELAGGLW